MAVGNLVADGVQLFVFVDEDHVVLVQPHHRAVGRDHHHVEVVDAAEFGRLGVGGAGHPGQLAVQLEIVLEGDRGHGAVAMHYSDALFRLDRLVQTIRVAAPVQDASGELVDDLYLAILDHVVDIAVEQAVGAQRLGEVVNKLEVVVGEQRVVDDPAVAQQLLDGGHALIGERDPFALFVHLVVALELVALRFVGILAGRRVLGHFGEPIHQSVDLRELRGVVFGGSGDDQRRTRLVDQDGVDFVDDAEVMAALHLLPFIPVHVVAQVVEAEFVVGAVGHVAAVGRAPARAVHVRQDRAHRDAEQIEHLAHPGGLQLHQVVVDGDDVHAAAGERVEVGGGDAAQGLALAGLHFQDRAAVQDGAAHQLAVVNPFAQPAPRRFAHQGERFRREFVQSFAVCEAAAATLRGGRKIGGVQGNHARFQLVDAPDQRRERLQIALVFRA